MTKCRESSLSLLYASALIGIDAIMLFQSNPLGLYAATSRINKIAHAYASLTNPFLFACSLNTRINKLNNFYTGIPLDLVDDFA